MIKELLARLLPQKNHFHGGLHITPPRHKSMSTGAPSRAAALSAEYAISLRQRDGSAYLAKVAPGERVLRGQLLAEPVNSQDAPVHAPTSGTIRAIEPRPEMHPANQPVPHLILESDGKDEAVPPLPALDPESSDADTLRERIAACGIVGLGGAGFPTARKLGHPANTLVINAAECEPYITCDDLQIRENAADIIRGAQIAAKILNAEHIHFGIEDDKPQAIAALERAAADLNDPRIKISSVPTRYPSGNARQLFELLLGVRVPADQHASDYGLICHNSGTLKAVYDAVIRGEPLTERYTTISGEGINQPQVLRIRTGAPARDLIAQAGGEKGDNRYIIGGPMMGYEIASADTPLQKTGNSLLLLPTIEPAEESPCIRCSRCADACPMELLPQQLLWYSQSDEHKRLKQYRLFDCIECGICAAVCPSAIPLVQYYRHSKGAIRAADDKARAAEHARARHEARTARLEREAAERQAQMDARRAKLQQNPAADKPERYTPAKETAPHQLPPNDDKTTAIEAAKARAAARRAERLTQNDDASTPAQTPAADDQTAAIEAAKARAAARKAARLAQNSDTETSAKIPPSPRGGGDEGGVHPYTTEADKKPAPHQLPLEPGKTAAIEAAKARAAARKAARLAQNSDSELLLPPQRSVAGDWNSSSEGRECWDGGSVSDSDTIVETPVKIPPSPRGGGDGGGVHPYTTEADKKPAPHQLPLEPGKTAAIEAAKARAAARKAARLAKSPNNDTPLQNLLTPPQPSPTGGGSAAVTEAPTAAKSPAPRQLPPDDNKTAAIEAAKARAAARKAARLAQNGETKTPPAATSPTEQPPPLQSASAPAAGEGWGGGSKHAATKYTYTNPATLYVNRPGGTHNAKPSVTARIPYNARENSPENIQMNPKTAPIAIIGAMEQEIALLQSRISQAQHEQVAHIGITRGTLAGKAVLLAQSGIGKVNAAITTAVLLEKYRAACVINTGSAGGLQSGMKQGDVVVGIQTAHHDADATAFDYVIGQLPQMPARYEADATLVEHAARAAVAFDGAAVHRGLIVSGDQFINHADKIARIREHFPDALAVEMEAAAIAQTCYQFARPYVIIRALSDLADGEAEYSFETFLQIAAKHSAEMVENLVKAL